EQLERRGFEVLRGAGRRGDGDKPAARVGLISHIGGHKFAGNVIAYVPPSAASVLAGCGVWYGRVRPELVEGIVKETVLGGRIIEDLCRGGISADGKPIML
ncbi:MAG: sucrase ferredoxin, partial [Terriglobus roseus]|nr:sucrase ferredoxin [Terriglobus roseus]